jgi:hypothetical protein
MKGLSLIKKQFTDILLQAVKNVTGYPLHSGKCTLKLDI